MYSIEVPRIDLFLSIGETTAEKVIKQSLQIYLKIDFSELPQNLLSTKNSQEYCYLTLKNEIIELANLKDYYLLEELLEDLAVFIKKRFPHLNEYLLKIKKFPLGNDDFPEGVMVSLSESLCRGR